MKNVYEIFETIRASLINNYITIEDNRRKLSNKEFLETVERLGIKLSDTVKPKSRCLVLCDNNLDTSISVLALWKLRAVPIIASTQYGWNKCEEIYKLTEPDYLLSNREIIPKFVMCDVYSVTTYKWLFKSNNERLTVKEEQLNNVVLIMCTSGTTGKPKGVMLSDAGLLSNVQDIVTYFNVSRDDSILIVRPLYHCAVFTGEFLVSIIKGVNIVFMDEGFNPYKIIETLMQKKISVMCGTPTIFYTIANIMLRLNKDLHLRVMAISGECLTETMVERIRECFKDTEIYNIYGLTEASPRVCYLKPALFDRYSQSVGEPLKTVEVEVVDDNNFPVKCGSKGNIVVRGPNVMEGYYKDLKATLNVIKDGWLNTGDTGVINDMGLLSIIGRKDNMIIKGGMNIYPREIEDRVLKCKEFEDVLVYRIQTELGHRIGMEIVPKNLKMKEKEIKKILSNMLPSYQYPDKIVIVNEIEKNQSGKKIRN